MNMIYDSGDTDGYWVRFTIRFSGKIYSTDCFFITYGKKTDWNAIEKNAYKELEQWINIKTGGKT